MCLTVSLSIYMSVLSTQELELEVIRLRKEVVGERVERASADRELAKLRSETQQLENERDALVECLDMLRIKHENTLIMLSAGCNPEWEEEKRILLTKLNDAENKLHNGNNRGDFVGVLEAYNEAVYERDVCKRRVTELENMIETFVPEKQAQLLISHSTNGAKITV